jgi:hypothetical protein
MKTVVREIPCLKVTVRTASVLGGWKNTSSKTCRKAHVAAEFYARTKNYEWWSNTGHLGRQPHRYVEKDARGQRLYRRALRVFKQYLP